MTDRDAELAWVRDAQAGSAEAFSRLVAAHQQALRAFLRKLSRNEADADDLAQETFVLAWNAIGRFEAHRSFRAWLFGIGWRKYRQGRRGWLRLLQRETRYADEQVRTVTPDPGLRLDLAAATNALPPEQRAAVLLCLAYEFSHAEAAEALALPLGTIKSHVARGREKLIASLGDAHG
jgi:RNA polymerase sigma-70 factor (ECF subfamily)